MAITRSRIRRAATGPVICAVIVGIALVGLLLGFGRPAPGWSTPAPDRPTTPAAGLMEAPRYAEINARARGPNRDYQSDVRSLVSNAPLVTDPVIQTAADKELALARRAARRAYAGAPPVIPHPASADQPAVCLSCHANGVRVGDRIGPQISHRHLTNCTQCHALDHPGSTAPGNLPGDITSDHGAASALNRAVGHPGPSAGLRAYPGAPPQMPHPTSMRENCTSCHGVLGQPGLRTTHPERMNCIQCHAQSAELNQTRFPEPPPAPWLDQAKP
jgi:cytochrome c-type protein NapB